MKARTAGRLAWSLLALFIGIAAVGLVLQSLNGTPRLEDYLLALAFAVLGTCGAFIASRRPENPIGWLLCAVAFFPALGFVGYEYAYYAIHTDPGALPAPRWAAWVSNWAWAPGLGLLGTFLLLLFPSGKLPSRRWRVVAWVGGAGVALVALLGSVIPGPIDELEPVQNPLGVTFLPEGTVEAALGAAFLVVTAMSLLSAASMVIRFRRSRGEERQQLKWFTFAAVFTALAVFLGDWLPLPDEVGGLVVITGIMAISAATVIAILKYRLYDIDVVINKTVVYGVLAAFVTGVYLALVVGIGAAVGSRSNIFLSILATAVIAVAFQPVRERARHVADRLVYGKRATPYEVLSEFAGRMAASYSNEDVLPRLARIVSEATGAGRSEVWLRVGAELRRAAAWPPEAASSASSLPAGGDAIPPLPGMEHVFPVRHSGETLGALALTKAPGEELTPTEEKLLSDLASQAGLVLRNARLIEELRASRQRLVTAQDAERRRIERNIHDGAQQQLVALAVKMGLARTLLDRSPQAAGELLDALKADAQQALDDLRDLARGIYPPLLADRGLGEALAAQGRKSAIPVEVDVDGIGRYPQETEAAVYFCVLEALQNAAKYSGASAVTVALAERNGHLAFSVSDDGAGFDPSAAPKGVGLTNMADRLAALGGEVQVASTPGAGTTVAGKVPIQDEAS